MNMMFEPLRKYADFQGRARRSEYWMFALFVLIVDVVLYALLGMSGSFGPGAAGPSGGALIVLLMLSVFGLAMFIPSLAVGVRRLHDTNRSGWWLLLGLVPFLGIVILIFMLLPGTPGTNTYGADPKGQLNPNTGEVFS
jgi:uncharacterized membrane protein YhaH (DUF805 family)